MIKAKPFFFISPQHTFLPAPSPPKSLANGVLNAVAIHRDEARDGSSDSDTSLFETAPRRGLRTTKTEQNRPEILAGIERTSVPDHIAKVINSERCRSRLYLVKRGNVYESTIYITVKSREIALSAGGEPETPALMLHNPDASGNMMDTSRQSRLKL